MKTQEIKDAINRLHIRSDIHPKDPDVSVLIDLAQRYLSASEVMPEKKMTYEHREVNGMKEVDGRYNAGFNDCLDACTLTMMKKCEGLEEVMWCRNTGQ